MGVATTYSVPGETLTAGVAVLLVAVLSMAGILEAAAQPAQPEAPAPAAPAAVVPPALVQPADVPAAPPAVETGTAVALVVPLTGSQQALGRAVRDGFVAAHLAAGSPADVRFTVLDEVAGAAGAWQAAVAANAQVVVGPLLKNSVLALAGLPRDRPVLALNFLPDGMAPPFGFYQFGLAPEDESREAARRALSLGQRRALVLVPDNEWGRRVLAAFADEFRGGGGDIVATRAYELAGDFASAVEDVLGPALPAPPADPALPPTAATTGANPVEGLPSATGPRFRGDVVFLGANSSAARQIRPQLRFFGAGRLPVYSTSAVYEDGAAPDRDLDGIQFPDTPWIIDPDNQARAVRAALRADAPGALSVSRLYALGYDAYALATQVREGRMAGLDLDGATGRLSAGPDGRVVRRLPWARFQDGRPVPASVALEDTMPLETTPPAEALPLRPVLTTPPP